MITLSQIPDDATCETCRWWENKARHGQFKGSKLYGEDNGVCYRYPPSISDRRARDKNILCGEWTPIPEKKS